MTSRDRSLIAALAVAFLAFSSIALAPSLIPAGSTASPGPTLPVERRYVEGVLGHATSVSPFGARSAADRELTALLFRGLVRLGPGDSVVGDLASSWDVDPSGATWTFHLRPGMHWQDGEPITSADVVFTISSLADPAYEGPGAASWREVQARAVDPLTVSLTLATPLGGFLQAATQPIAPVHILGDVPVAELATDGFGQLPVGSGPFRLATLDERHAVLDAADPVPAGAGPVASAPAGSSESPTTVFPRPYLGGVELRFFDDPAALRAAWDAGTLDGASGLAPADAAELGARPDSRLLRYPSSTLLAVVLNLRAGHTTFGNPAVRRALLEAIDRDRLLVDPLVGFGSVARSLIPDWAPEFDAAASPLIAFDPAAARKDLAGAGWKRADASWIPKGAKAPIAISVLSADRASNAVAFDTAEAVAAAWRAIGLEVVHDAVPATDLLAQRVGPGHYDAVVLPLVIGLDPDLYPLLASTQTKTGGANVAGLQDPALDKLLAAARAPGSEAAHLAAYARLQARLASQLYLLPLAFREEVVVLRSTVQGPAPRPVAGPGDRFWDVLTWHLAEAQPSG
jgi:peptide/nickel transport system substrate-binding protein